MEEKEPFKIKFTTVLIVVCVLFIIIGILAFNLKRLEDALVQTSNSQINKKTKSVLEASFIEPNDYNYFSENYQKALKSILNPTEEESGLGKLSIFKSPVGLALKGISSIEIDSLGDTYLNIEQSSPLYEKYGKTTKIASNVFDIEICPEGQNEFSNLYFIHNDGTVSKLAGFTREENGTLKGELSLEKLSTISEIVKIISIPTEDANIVAFVDVNGYIYDINGEGF